MKRLDGKVAVVTGGASGIGRGIVERFVAEGAQVVAGDINDEDAQALAQATGCTVVHCDVTSEDEQQAMIDTAVERYGRLDIAVANAGIGYSAPVVDHPLDGWQRVLDLCLTGAFLTVKASARAMSSGGSIIAIASLNAIQPSRGMAAYCAAKAGVVALTEVAALELGPRDIRVNAIAPGLVRTATTEPLWSLPGLVDEYVENTTVGRFAEPADIAALATFLASDEASFVSGTMHLIDGGAHLNRYPNMWRALGLDAHGQAAR